MNIQDAIKAKSDQLNADDLLGGSIIVEVTNVTKGSAEQPVVIHITGGHQPWKPSKTSLRVLANCWGLNSSSWVGQVLELYCEPSVKWAGKAVGGIRTKALSGIEQPKTIMVAVTRGKKEPVTVSPLKKVDSAEHFNTLEREEKMKHWNYLPDELKQAIKSNSEK